MYIKLCSSENMATKMSLLGAYINYDPCNASDLFSPISRAELTFCITFHNDLQQAVRGCTQIAYGFFLSDFSLSPAPCTFAFCIHAVRNLCDETFTV